jgi:hypothetical protein
MEEFNKLPVSSLPFDGYLMLNGQLLLDSERRVYSGTAIDQGEMEILAGIFSARHIPFVMIGENERYINYVNDILHNVDVPRKTFDDYDFKIFTHFADFNKELNVKEKDM